jgi:hypothetical protein
MLVKNPEGNRPFERPMGRWEESNKLNFEGYARE